MTCCHNNARIEQLWRPYHGASSVIVNDLRLTRKLRLESAVGGFMIGVFQLVGRSYFGQFVGAGDRLWYLQLRLWVLTALSIWLLGVVVAQVPGAVRGFAGGVRRWSVMIVIFVAYMVVTALWAPEPTLAAMKAYDLWYIAWSCSLTVVALRVCGVGSTISGFWLAVFGLGAFLAAAGVSAAIANPSVSRLSALGGGPNVFGRNMGLLTLAALHFVLEHNKRRVRTVALSIVPIAALLVLFSGSRGAMIALFVGVVVYLIARRFDRRTRVTILLSTIAGAVAVSTVLGRRAISVFGHRFLRLLLVEGYTSNRTSLLIDGITAGLENPIGGMGLAGFAQVDSYGTYPHNIIVEAFAEGGVFGLVFLCIPFGMFVWHRMRGRRLSDPVTVAGLLLLGVSSSISGDLFDARGVFLLLLMAVASQRGMGTESRAGVGVGPKQPPRNDNRLVRASFIPRRIAESVWTAGRSVET